MSEVDQQSTDHMRMLQMQLETAQQKIKVAKGALS